MLSKFINSKHLKIHTNKHPLDFPNHFWYKINNSSIKILLFWLSKQYYFRLQQAEIPTTGSPNRPLFGGYAKYRKCFHMSVPFFLSLSCNVINNFAHLSISSNKKTGHILKHKNALLRKSSIMVAFRGGRKFTNTKH